MLHPVQITFRGMETSPAIDALVRKHAGSLSRFDDRVLACRVTIERPHRHHRVGGHVHVRVDLTVPGGEVIVNRDPTEHAASADAAVAVQRAFKEARRQLQDIARKRREFHPEADVRTARVVDIAPDHGFLLTPDGREVYFHRNAVLGDRGWDGLDVGDEVRFDEEQGVEGPQASTVTPLHRHAAQ